MEQSQEQIHKYLMDDNLFEFDTDDEEQDIITTGHSHNVLDNDHSTNFSPHPGQVKSSQMYFQSNEEDKIQELPVNEGVNILQMDPSQENYDPVNEINFPKSVGQKYSSLSEEEAELMFNERKKTIITSLLSSAKVNPNPQTFNKTSANEQSSQSLQSNQTQSQTSQFQENNKNTSKVHSNIKPSSSKKKVMTLGEATPNTKKNIKSRIVAQKNSNKRETVKRYTEKKVATRLKFKTPKSKVKIENAYDPKNQTVPTNGFGFIDLSSTEKLDSRLTSNSKSLNNTDTLQYSKFSTPISLPLLSNDIESTSRIQDTSFAEKVEQQNKLAKEEQESTILEKSSPGPGKVTLVSKQHKQINEKFMEADTINKRRGQSQEDQLNKLLNKANQKLVENTYQTMNEIQTNQNKISSTIQKRKHLSADTENTSTKEIQLKYVKMPLVNQSNASGDQTKKDLEILNELSKIENEPIIEDDTNTHSSNRRASSFLSSKYYSGITKPTDSNPNLHLISNLNSDNQSNLVISLSLGSEKIENSPGNAEENILKEINELDRKILLINNKLKEKETPRNTSMSTNKSNRITKTCQKTENVNENFLKKELRKSYSFRNLGSNHSAGPMFKNEGYSIFNRIQIRNIKGDYQPTPTGEYYTTTNCSRESRPGSSRLQVRECGSSTKATVRCFNFSQLKDLKDQCTLKKQVFDSIHTSKTKESVSPPIQKKTIKRTKIYDRNVQWKENKKSKHEEQKKINEDSAVENCTFKPKIIRETYEDRINPVIKTYDFLTRNKKWSEHKEKKITQQKEIKKQTEMDGCTFYPQAKTNKKKPILTSSKKKNKREIEEFFQRNLEWQNRKNAHTKEKIKNMFYNDSPSLISTQRSNLTNITANNHSKPPRKRTSLPEKHNSIKKESKILKNQHESEPNLILNKSKTKFTRLEKLNKKIKEGKLQTSANMQSKSEISLTEVTYLTGKNKENKDPQKTAFIELPKPDSLGIPDAWSQLEKQYENETKDFMAAIENLRKHFKKYINSPKDTLLQKRKNSQPSSELKSKYSPRIDLVEQNTCTFHRPSLDEGQINDKKGIDNVENKIYKMEENNKEERNEEIYDEFCSEEEMRVRLKYDNSKKELEKIETELKKSKDILQQFKQSTKQNLPPPKTSNPENLPINQVVSYYYNQPINQNYNPKIQSLCNNSSVAWSKRSGPDENLNESENESIFLPNVNNGKNSLLLHSKYLDQTFSSTSSKDNDYENEQELEMKYKSLIENIQQISQNILHVKEENKKIEKEIWDLQSIKNNSLYERIFSY